MPMEGAETGTQATGTQESAAGTPEARDAQDTSGPPVAFAAHIAFVA